MYISAVRKNDEVLVWERNEGERELVHYRAPYYFYVKHKDGKHESIYGDKLVRFDFTTYAEYKKAIQDAKSYGFETFETDIAPELRVLSEHYYNAEVPNLHVSFYDIEVDYNPEIGFAGPDNPYAPINSVAIYHRHSNRNVVLAVPPENSNWKPGKAPKEFVDELESKHPLPKEFNNEIYFCKDEKELLLKFLEEIHDSDVILGWNSDVFDLPYIGKRLEKLGKQKFNQLSFMDAHPPRWRTVEIMKREVQLLDISGRNSSDYMVLFKKYEMEERPSYKLESIADEILPELPKLEYEGSLADLYRNDFAYFVRYNIRDTEILEGFEQKLGYVSLANEMYHISCGLFSHVSGTLKLADLAIINYCHYELGKRVNDVAEPDDSGSAQGAYVLVPQIGMHDWIGSIDIASLYPSSIISINISPETLCGQFKEHETAVEQIYKQTDMELTLEIEDNISDTNILSQWRGDYVTKTAKQWRKYLLKNKMSISGYGTVFDQRYKGVIPSILSLWYKTRKTYKKKMKDTSDKGTQEYYDRLQYVFKIKLNSLYGALLNKYFRFGDNRMGESTTATGRNILRHQCAQVCKLLDGEYTLPNNKVVDKNGKEHWGYTEDHSVIYGDTDSSYFKIPANNLESAIKVGNGISELVNQSFQPFMQEKFLCQPGFDDAITAEREIVSDRGIFVDKKRYFLHIVDDEGKDVDKIKVMGLDTKKTTLPKEISKEINKFVERLLKGESWEVISQDIVDYKENLASENIMKIGLPKGIKGIEDYYQEYKIYGEGTRLPGHVAAGIFYNICREQYNDKKSIPIISGMKIKVFYLTKKYGKFKSIAIPVDIEEIPEWFSDFPVDKDAQIERLVDKPLRNIIKAIGKESPTKQSLYVESVLEF